jgi:hypothetical protein
MATTRNQKLGQTAYCYGGYPKARKMHFHLIDFQWKRRGGRQYIGHNEDETAAVFIPLPNGLTAPIQHGAVDDAQKTLGIITCPSGNTMGSLMQKKGKNQKMAQRFDKWAASWSYDVV